MLWLFALFVACVVALPPSDHDLTFQVEPRMEECFYQELQISQEFPFQFEVIRGGLQDIELRVVDPTGVVLMQKMAFFNNPDDRINEQTGRISFSARTPGVHAICFNNKMSRWTAKVIGFHQLGAKQQRREELAKLEHLGPVVDSVIKISDKLDEIEHAQKSMRNREHVHRDTQESTNWRVQWLSVLEMIVLVGLNLMQIYWIRKWFSGQGQRRRV
ncbi:MAG: hypothetical protein MHM6MM_002343 [Cercozoa sp. M6MM]